MLHVFYPYSTEDGNQLRAWLQRLHEHDLEIEIINMVVIPAGGNNPTQLYMFYRLFPCEFGEKKSAIYP